MAKSIISEGKTTNEAIEKGLEQLKVSRKMVDVKVLEDEQKRSFFSILTPRVVKVELTVKEEKTGKKIIKSTKKVEKKEIILSEEEQQQAKGNVENFLKDFIKYLPENTEYTVKTTASGLEVNLSSDKLGFLIGYRGETLNSFQNILASIAGKDLSNRVRVILDIEGYKEKRKDTLEQLAEKVAKTVIKTNKSVTLEPMGAYERKIIHTKLQNNSKVETISIGEEPRRRVVIQLKNN